MFYVCIQFIKSYIFLSRHLIEKYFRRKFNTKKLKSEEPIKSLLNFLENQMKISSIVHAHQTLHYRALCSSKESNATYWSSHPINNINKDFPREHKTFSSSYAQIIGNPQKKFFCALLLFSAKNLKNKRKTHTNKNQDLFLKIFYVFLSEKEKRNNKKKRENFLYFSRLLLAESKLS